MRFSTSFILWLEPSRDLSPIFKSRFKRSNLFNFFKISPMSVSQKPIVRVPESRVMQLNKQENVQELTLRIKSCELLVFPVYILLQRQGIELSSTVQSLDNTVYVDFSTLSHVTKYT